MKDENKRREGLVDYMMANAGHPPLFSRDEARLMVDVASKAVDNFIDNATMLAEKTPHPSVTLAMAFKTISANVPGLLEALADIERMKEMLRGPRGDTCDCEACNLRRELMAMGAEVLEMGDGFVAMRMPDPKDMN